MKDIPNAHLSRLSERAEIMDVLSAYAHGIDRIDRTLVLACFHPDATFQFGGAPPAPVVDFFAENTPGTVALRGTSHHLSNFLIDFDGDCADTQVYLMGYHLVAADAPK